LVLVLFSLFLVISASGQSVTGCTGTEIEKQLGLWERRVKGLRRMLLGWDQARPPDPPSAVTVDVIGLNSVQVRVQEPANGPLCTKFRGECGGDKQMRQTMSLSSKFVLRQTCEAFKTFAFYSRRHSLGV
jgi:hypothetical protein